MDVDVKEDGIVGDWHRWVIISVASTVLMSYFFYATVNMFMLFSGLAARLGYVPARDLLDLRVLLFAIPWGVLRGEMGYQKDLATNGPKAATNELSPVPPAAEKGSLI